MEFKTGDNVVYHYRDGTKVKGTIIGTCTNNKGKLGINIKTDDGKTLSNYSPNNATLETSTSEIPALKTAVKEIPEVAEVVEKVSNVKEPKKEVKNMDKVNITENFAVKVYNPSEEKSYLVPKKRHYILENPHIEEVIDAYNNNENVLIIGEPGCGKSQFVLYLHALANKPVRQLQGDGDMSVVDIIGGYQYDKERGGTYWVDGELTKAVREGDTILFDEINMALPEILSRIHPLLDERRHLELKEKNEVVHAHPDFKFFATMNPSDTGRHAGTKPLSPALLDRFHCKVKFNYLSPEQEIKLLVKETGITEEDAKKITVVGNTIREGFRNQEISTPATTRQLLRWAKVSTKFGLARAIVTTVLNDLTEDDIEVMRGVLLSHGLIKPKKNGNTEEKKDEESEE